MSTAAIAQADAFVELDSELAKLHEVNVATASKSSTLLTPEQFVEYARELSVLVVDACEAGRLRSVRRQAMARALLAHIATLDRSTS